MNKYNKFFMSWKFGLLFFILTFLVFLSDNDKYKIFIIILFSFWFYLKIMIFFSNIFKNYLFSKKDN